jgi:hypothetical protein
MRRRGLLSLILIKSEIPVAKWKIPHPHARDDPADLALLYFVNVRQIALDDLGISA